MEQYTVTDRRGGDMRKVREAVCYGIALTGIEALIGSFAAYGQGWIPGMKCLGIAGMAAAAIAIGMAEAEGEQNEH